MRDFHKLLVWQKAHQLTLAVYRETGAFPKAEVNSFQLSAISHQQKHTQVIWLRAES